VRTNILRFDSTFSSSADCLHGILAFLPHTNSEMSKGSLREDHNVAGSSYYWVAPINPVERKRAGRMTNNMELHSQMGGA